jgi:hypothetical protein
MINNGTPTLIIGVGGIGCRIAAEISDSLSPEDKRYVSVIGMDTNVHDIAQIRDRHYMKIIQISDDRPVKFHLEQHPEYREWFPENDNLLRWNIMCGSGMIRAMTRLACLAAAEGGRLDMIRDEIERIRKASPGCSSISVAIVGTICGGTGSALAVMLPFYLRELIREQSGLQNMKMIGCFIGQGALCNLLPGADIKDLARANAYACMREWNAFYLAARYPMAENNLKLDWYHPEHGSGDSTPYGRIFLLEDFPENNSPPRDNLDYPRHIIKQLVFQTLTIMSVEDGMQLTRPDSALRSYSSAGLVQLIYPREAAQEYVTCSVLAKKVEQVWLRIDRIYSILLRTAQEQSKIDPSAVLPEKNPTWASLFREECSNAHSPFARIACDAFVTDGDSGVLQPRSDEIMHALEDAVCEVLDSEELARITEECRVDVHCMQSMEEAQYHIRNVTKSIDSLNQCAKKLIFVEPYRIAEQLLPDFTFTTNIPDTPFFQILKAAHPVAARFLVIDLINRLEELEREMREVLAQIDLNVIAQRDYDPKTEGIQDPLEYLWNTKSRESWIWRALGTVGQRLSPTAAAIKKLARTFREDADIQVALVRKYVECSVKSMVAHRMLQRLLILEEAYQTLLEAAAESRADALEEVQYLEKMPLRF